MEVHSVLVRLSDFQKAGFFWSSYFNAQRNIRDVHTIWNMQTGKSSFLNIFPTKLSANGSLKLQVLNLPVTYLPTLDVFLETFTNIFQNSWFSQHIWTANFVKNKRLETLERMEEMFAKDFNFRRLNYEIQFFLARKTF